MIRFNRVLILLLSFSCWMVAVRADTLVFANGDRLTGRLLKEEAGQIHFESAALGLLVVPVTTARAEVPPPAPAPKTPEELAREARLRALTREFRPVEIRQAAQDPDRAKKAELVDWRRKVEFGFTAAQGATDRTDLALRFEVARRVSSSEIRLQARYLYGMTDDTRTADSANANLRFRRDLSPVLFGQSVTRFDRDLVKRVNYDVEQSLGFGRNVLDRDHVVLALGAGAAARRRDTLTTPPGWVVRVDAFQDLTYEFNDRFRLNQDLAMLVAPDGTDELTLKLNAALSGRITQTLEMTMRYEYEYDRAVAPDARTNQRLVTSLGYVF